MNSAFYCRKCQQFLPEKKFYKAVDNGLVDSNGKLSVCKECSQNIYDVIFQEQQNMESTLHKMCTTLNIKFSNEAIDATKKHVDTMLSNGKNVKAIFSIYLMKLIATNPSMDKSADIDMTYSDIATVYVDKLYDAEEIPLAKEVLERWGDDIPREDIEFLEREYTKFAETYKTKTHAEVVLLKQACQMILNIDKLGKEGEDTTKQVRSLRELMKTLEISPDAISAGANTSEFEKLIGVRIRDMEKYTPAQWYKDNMDKYGSLRDVNDAKKYFREEIVVPMKNFITGSRDFGETDLLNESEVDYE